MKKVLYSLFLALMAQSCSHLVVYQEMHYSCTDSPYPFNDMQFAYYASGKKLSSSLREMGDRISMNAQKDNAYNSYLASTDEFEANNYSFMVAHRNFQEMVDSSKIALASIKSSNNHSQAEIDGESLLFALSDFDVSNLNLKEYWRRAYHLSHRSILQHYMTTNDQYSDLSKKKQMLLYGYVLSKDAAKCDEFAGMAVKRDKAIIDNLQAGITAEVKRHVKIQEEIKRQEEERREKARLELLRKEEAERQKQAEERAQAEARYRRNHDDWMDGHWRTQTIVKAGFYTKACTYDLYIDTNSQKVRFLSTLTGSASKLLYYGSYSIYNDAGSGYKVIKFGGYQVFANPDARSLFDKNGGYGNVPY